MSSADNNSMHNGYAKVRYELPYAREREKMSILQLAEYLSSVEKGTPGYIVVEHELNLKIAKVQAKATLNAGWIGASASIIAVLLTFALGFYTGSSKSKEPNDTKCEKTTTRPASNTNGDKAKPEKTAPVIQVAPPKSLEVPVRRVQ